MVPSVSADDVDDHDAEADGDDDEAAPFLLSTALFGFATLLERLFFFLSFSASAFFRLIQATTSAVSSG